MTGFEWLLPLVLGLVAGAAAGVLVYKSRTAAAHAALAMEREQAERERDLAETDLREAREALRARQHELEATERHAGDLESRLSAMTERAGHFRNRIAEVQEAAAQERQRVEGQHREALERATRAHAEAVEKLERRHAEAMAKREAELKAALEEQETSFTKLEGRMKDAFATLSQELLEQKGKTFATQSQEQIGALLKPIQEKMQAFEKEVRETREKNVEGQGRLQEQLRQLTELNQQMSREAQSLVQALEGQTKTQGDWGEVILERILETAGLRQGTHFLREQTLQHEDGRRVRPDVVVLLPDERCLVVDAKVSIVAYRRYCDADDDAARADALKAHLQAVRNHVTGLSGKRYEDLHGGKSPDFVLLFIPVEPAFSLALQHDEALYQEAFQRNIVLVSPTTLLAAMAMVQNLWKHEYRTQNIEQIAERGARLYDKFVLFTEALEEIGQRLQQAQAAYDTAMGRLSTGNGNLVRQAEKLRALGIKANKQLSSTLAARAEETMEEDDPDAAPDVPLPLLGGDGSQQDGHADAPDTA